MAVKIEDWMGSTKYVAPSKAIVIDNKDPKQKGRIRVDSPVYGKSPWIHYITVEDGFFGPPDVGSVVIVEADGGDPDYIIARGTINDGLDEDSDTPQEFRRYVPTNRGWSSPGELNGLGEVITPNGGHTLELDDGMAILSNGTVVSSKELKGVRLTTSGGHSFNMFEEGTDGQQQNRIQLTTSGNQIIQMVDDEDSEKQNITLKDSEERTIEIIKDSDRIRIRNKSGTIFIDIDFANDTIEIDADNVKLGTAAAESIVRGDAFRTLFNSHRHVSGAPGVPTDVPLVPMDPASANTHLSSKHKVE